MIKVKALEFSLNADEDYEAEGFAEWVGDWGYRITWRDYRGTYLAELIVPNDCCEHDEQIGDGEFESLESAKAACQAHHTQHVLSMIEGEG